MPPRPCGGFTLGFPSQKTGTHFLTTLNALKPQTGADPPEKRISHLQTPLTTAQIPFWVDLGEIENFNFFRVLAHPAARRAFPEKRQNRIPGAPNEPQIRRKETRNTRFPPPNTSNNHRKTIWERFGKNKKKLIFFGFSDLKSAGHPLTGMPRNAQTHSRDRSNERTIARRTTQTTCFPPPNTSNNHRDMIWDRFGKNKNVSIFFGFGRSRRRTMPPHPAGPQPPHPSRRGVAKSVFWP